MKRLFWSLVLLGAYVWSVTTGRDQFVLDQGKRIYRFVTVWLSEAEVDTQMNRTLQPSKKKKSRRWD